MKASEALAISNKAKEAVDISLILTSIKNAATIGHTTMRIAHISRFEAEKLQALGYKIEQYSDPRDQRESHYTISWSPVPQIP